MEWKSPFVIYRINAEGKLEQVYVAADMKQAKYWLTYIALPGDILCRSPLHPKHSKKGASPEYWLHRGESKECIPDENAWRKLAEERKCDLQFPLSESLDNSAK